MRLVTYVSGLSAARLGVLADGLVVDVERFGSAHGLALPDDMLSFIDNGVTLLPVLKELLGGSAERLPAGSALPLENVSLQAPIPRPRKNIFGIGLNYREHVAESAKSLDTDNNRRRSRRGDPSQRQNDPTARLGGRTGRDHRKDRDQDIRRKRNEPRFRILGNDRRLRARQSTGRPMDLFKGHGYLRTLRPLHRDRRRDPGSSRSAPVADQEWRQEAGFQRQVHDLRCSIPDRGYLVRHYA